MEEKENKNTALNEDHSEISENTNDDASDIVQENTNTDTSSSENQQVQEKVEIESLEPEKKEQDVNPPEQKNTDQQDGENHDHEEHEDQHDDHEELDFSSHSKKELVEEIKKIAHDDDVMKADKMAQQLLGHYEEIHKKEKEEALNKYLEDGGEEDGFEFRNDELDDRFEANFQLIHDNKVKFLKNRDQERDSNLKKKEEVLEKLRHFVDSEETNISFDQFKNIQNEWKEIGPIPQANAKTLWANYHALIDRFYDNRSIYYELKELDRKKNLDSKLELCKRAEKLIDHSNLKEAIAELNELHNEFKHIGPVPKESQEELWERFKAASDSIYQRRKVFVEDLKKTLDENLVKKTVLCEKVKEFTEFNSDRIKEWNSKTSEILNLQKEWDAIGGLPRNKAKEINKEFWGAFKSFFNNKNHFFKKLDEQREGNLKLKEDLIKKAEELKDSDDYENVANALKGLQKEWKEIGPVPEKQREKSYQAFKAACDHFFERKRSVHSAHEKEYEINLTKKEEICKQIEDSTGSDGVSVDTLNGLRDEFLQIGFVPKKAIKKIKKRFDKAYETYLDAISDLTEEEKEDLLIKDEIERLKANPGNHNLVVRKEQEIRKNIHQLENDMSLWKNNLEFFSASKTADKLRDEFNEKIDTAEEKIRSLKHQLRVLRSNS